MAEVFEEIENVTEEKDIELGDTKMLKQKIQLMNKLIYQIRRN